MKKVILITLLLLLTGCYDYNELTDLGIVSSMFIDYVDDTYKVDLEILDTNEKVTSPSYFISGTGNTFNNALNNLYTKTTKEIYLNHINAVIVSKRFAKDKMSELYDYFVRAPYIRKDSYFFITETPSDFIGKVTKDNMAIGESLKNTLEYSYKDYGYYMTSDFDTILSSYLNNKTYPLGEISFIDKTIILGNTYLIKDNKLDIKIDKDAILLANLLNDNITSFTISKDNTFEIYKYNVSKKVANNTITLDFSFDVRLKNIQTISINTNEEKKRVEKKISEFLSDVFKKSIEYSLTMDDDIYNFNYCYYLKYPKKVKKDTFKSIKYEINVKTKINEKGLLIGTRNE